VIRVENDGNTVVRGDGTDVHGHGDGTSGSGVGILDSLAREKGGSAVGALDHDRTVVFLGGFQDTIAGGRTRERNKQKR
jgi:hypothetical protein